GRKDQVRTGRIEKPLYLALVLQRSCIEIFGHLGRQPAKLEETCPRGGTGPKITRGHVGRRLTTEDVKGSVGVAGLAQHLGRFAQCGLCIRQKDDPPLRLNHSGSTTKCGSEIREAWRRRISRNRGYHYVGGRIDADPPVSIEQLDPLIACVNGTADYSKQVVCGPLDHLQDKRRSEKPRDLSGFSSGGPWFLARH